MPQFLSFCQSLSKVQLLKVAENNIVDVRIAMGAVAPTVVRITAVEKELINLPDRLAANPKLYSKVSRNIAPISDYRGSKTYRLEVARNLLRATILELLD